MKKHWFSAFDQFLLAELTLIQIGTISFALLLLGWLQKISFLPAVALIVFVFFKFFRSTGLSTIIRKISLTIVTAAILTLSLNLLTIDLRRAGDRFHTRGIQAVTSGQIATAYFATVGMGLGGFLVGAPYAAMENLRLLLPNSGELTVEDNFPMKSKKVRDLIDEAKRRGSGLVKAPLVWGSYCQDHCDVAYALNGGKLVVEVTPTQCLAKVSVAVAYKPQYRSSTLASLPFLKLRIDQAAIHVAQELGYLFPYNIHYQWDC